MVGLIGHGLPNIRVHRLLLVARLMVGYIGCGGGLARGRVNWPWLA